MLHRILPIFKKHILIFILLVALIIVSSVTTGQLATATSVAAGIVMIYIGISFTVWIIKTPSKKNKEEVA